MKITVENLNKLYMPVFIKIDKLTKFLGSHCVEHALDFQYGHSNTRLVHKYTSLLPLYQ